MAQLQDIHNAETNDSSYDHILKYTGILGFVQVLKMLIDVVRVKLTSLILGVSGIGLIAIYSSVVEFLSRVSNMGIPINATRTTSELFDHGTDEEISQQVAVIRTWTLWTALLSVLVCLLFSPLISYAFYDNDWHHWSEVLLTAPIAAALILAEGECAILKGLRQLQKVAFIEASAAVSTLVATIPFYFMFGLKGVIMGLIASSIITAVLHFVFSLRIVPYYILPISKKTIHDGLPLVKVGIPFVLAGVSGSLLSMAIPAIILAGNSLSDVGYYKAGWQIIVGYSCLVFVALESDFFPRLSSVNHSSHRMSKVIDQQIDVCVLIIAPLLILLATLMPYVVQLLYSEEFLPVVTMATIAVFYPFFRSISLPLGYSIIARGESMLFLVLEVSYNVFFALIIWCFYTTYGLAGIGIGISLGAFSDIFINYSIALWRYKCNISKKTIRLCAFQFVALSVTVVALLCGTGVLPYTVSSVCFACSFSLSTYWLYRHSSFIGHLVRRFRK